MTSTLKPHVATYTTPNDLDVVGTRVFDAPRHLVFDAFTKPELVSRWLLGPDGWTMPICEIDLRPGGSWRYVWRHEDGREMSMRGVYREIVPPERVVWTERYLEFPESVNSLILAESGGQTTMTMTMRYASKEMRDMVLKTGMTTGMDRSFARLDDVLESSAA